MYNLSDLNNLSYIELFNLFCNHFYGVDFEPTREYLTDELLSITPKIRYS